MFIARDMDGTDISYVACTNEYEYEHNGRSVQKHISDAVRAWHAAEMIIRVRRRRKQGELWAALPHLDISPKRVGGQGRAQRSGEPARDRQRRRCR